MAHTKGPRLPPGEGLISLRSSSSRSCFSTLQAAYPLKLLTPSPLPSQPANVAALYTLAYGGGLVAGDTVGLRGEVGEGCGLVMLTQGSTKVFKRRPGLRPQSHTLTSEVDPRSDPNLTRQRMQLSLSPNSFLLLLPDSISPFAASTYSQVQRFMLPADETASVLILDWVNSGRGQRPGEPEKEIWTMDRYASTNEVYVGERLVLRERMVLDNSEHSGEQGSTLSSIAHQLSPYNIYATLLFLGPHLYTLRVYLKQMSHQTRQYQIKEPPGLVWSFSEVDEKTGAGVVRVAAREVEDARIWLRGIMSAANVGSLVGEGFWPRCI